MQARSRLPTGRQGFVSPQDKKTAYTLPERIAFGESVTFSYKQNLLSSRKYELLLPRTEEYKKGRRASDGKLVNVGNFDADGANVNRNTPDNSNDLLGVSFSRSLCPALNGGVFLFRLKASDPATQHSSDFFQR